MMKNSEMIYYLNENFVLLGIGQYLCQKGNCTKGSVSNYGKGKLVQDWSIFVPRGGIVLGRNCSSGLVQDQSIFVLEVNEK